MTPCNCSACREKGNQGAALRAFHLRSHLVNRYGEVHWLTRILYNCNDFGGSHIAYDIPLPL